MHFWWRNRKRWLAIILKREFVWSAFFINLIVPEATILERLLHRLFWNFVAIVITKLYAQGGARGYQLVSDLFTDLPYALQTNFDEINTYLVVMSYFVLCQVRAWSEVFAALFAEEWFSSRMDPFVANQIANLRWSIFKFMLPDWMSCRTHRTCTALSLHGCAYAFTSTSTGRKRSRNNH